MLVGSNVVATFCIVAVLLVATTRTRKCQQSKRNYEPNAQERSKIDHDLKEIFAILDDAERMGYIHVTSPPEEKHADWEVIGQWLTCCSVYVAANVNIFHRAHSRKVTSKHQHDAQHRVLSRWIDMD